jgi:hypothetical protein
MNEEEKFSPLPPAQQGNSEFEATIRRRAERFGMSVAELQAHDRELLSAPDRYDDCLDPYEVEQFFSGSIPEVRAAHIDRCPMCAALVDVARPRENWFDEFIRSKAAQAVMRQSVKAQKQNIWKPILETSLIGAALGLAVAAFALYAIKTNDVLVSNLIRDTAPRAAAVIVTVGLLSVLVAVACAKFLSTSIPKFEEFGGWIIGGLFASFSCIYVAHTGVLIAKNYANLQTAQYDLLERIAYAQDQGKLYADSLFRERLKNLPGMLVAEREQQAIYISWEKPASYLRKARSSVLGTVYEGRFRSEPNGIATILVGDKAIDAGPDSFSARIRYNTNVKDIDVFALVPTDAIQAAAIVPVSASNDLR